MDDHHDERAGHGGSGNGISLRVWGPQALFTRPEHRVERVTYDVMTPGAARGILEAILWKPEMRWEVERIDVLRPIRHQEMRRNEVPASARCEVKRAVAEAAGGPRAAELGMRVQLSSRMLRDMEYVIHARIVGMRHAEHGPKKYREMFLRRAASGQCFHQPFLGKKEMPAEFALAIGSEQPIDLDLDLGPMLRELEFVRTVPDKDAATSPVRTMQVVNGAGDREMVQGHFDPRYFHAMLRRGTLHVPPSPQHQGAGRRA